MQLKKRRPFIALLLSIFLPGLGQVYNTQLKRGILFILADKLIPLFLLTTDLLMNFSGAVAFAMIALLIYVLIAIDAFVAAKRIQTTELKIYNKWYFYVLFIVFVGAISLLGESIVKDNFSNFRTYKVPTGAMAPTIVIGDHIMVDMEAYEEKQPRRGNVIVFEYPEDPSREFIKRIVAVGGDVIESRDKVIFINGEKVDSSFIMFDDDTIKPRGVEPRDNFGPLHVPENEYFVLGDRRDQSYDSRYWGFVSEDRIKGKVLYIYWSWDSTANTIRFERIGKKVE